jgi:hypothetical protein
LFVGWHWEISILVPGAIIKKIDPGTHKKLGMLNVIKQLQHFIECDIMCYGALKSNIDRGLRPWSILRQNDKNLMFH